MGRRFWVGRGCFFSWGCGEGEEELQVTTAETFSQDDTSSKQPCLCYILFTSQWGFHCQACLQVIEKGILDPRLTWTDTCDVRLRQPVDLVHTLKMVKGLLLFVPSRTPRNSGYDVYAHVFYVVMCYMSITCICLLYVVIYYMSVKCLCLLCV
jgi:hypothetical protein